MTATAQPETKILKPHEWTNGGTEVLILRFSKKDGTSCAKRLRDGNSVDDKPFQHPTKVGEVATADDWNEKPICGGGIHGWPWGLGLGEGKDCEWDALWQVYGAKPEDVVGEIENGQKCKFRTGTLRFVGDWHAAMLFVLDGQIAWVQQAARGAASSTGERGAASSTGESGAASSTGYRGAASSTGDSGAASSTGYSGAASSTGYSGAASSTGYRGAASSTGYRGAASSTGYRGAASSTGDSGAASSTGDSGAASSTGDSGAASSTGYGGAASSTGDSSGAFVTGLYGRAKAGKFGCIALAWWNNKENRSEMHCALVGQGKKSLKPNVWYRLDEETGKFVEAE